MEQQRFGGVKRTQLKPQVEAPSDFTTQKGVKSEILKAEEEKKKVEEYLGKGQPTKRFGSSVKTEQIISYQQATAVPSKYEEYISNLRKSLSQMQEEQRQKELYEKVLLQIERKAQGKAGSILDTTEERQLYAKLLKDNPSLREAVYAGQDARYRALELGFKNVFQYQEAVGRAKALGLDTYKSPSGETIAITQAGLEKLRESFYKLELEKQGIDSQLLKPIITPQGKLTGLQDITTGKSYSLDELESIRRRSMISEGIDPDTNKPILTIEKAKDNKGIYEKIEGFFSTKRAELETRIIRNEPTSFGSRLIGGFGAGIFYGLSRDIEFGKAILTQTPLSSIKMIGKGFYEFGKKAFTTGFPEVTETILLTPEFAFGYGLEQYYSTKAIGKITDFTASKAYTLSKTTGALITGKFKFIKEISPAEKAILDVPSIKGGTFDIPLAEKLYSVSSIEQVKLAGKEIVAISEAKDFFKLLKNEVKIDKPIIKGQPEIETSLFFDPYGKLRVSRVKDIEYEKPSFIDYLTEDISFKKPKEQALILEDVKVERFPKSLEIIKKKIISGEPLNVIEKQKLLEFQLKPSKQLKPIGKIKGDGIPTSEAEVTLPKGETLVKEKYLGRTLYKGKIIDIYRTSIKGATKQVISALEEIKRGENIKANIKLLEKETGIDYSYLKKEIYYSPYKVTAYLSKLKYYPEKDYAEYKTPTYPDYNIPKYDIPSYSPYKTPTYPDYNIPKYDIPILKELPIPRQEEEKKKEKFKGKEQAYNVYVKQPTLKGERKDIIVKISNKPLTKSLALSQGAYISDTSLGAKFFIKQTSGKPIRSTNESKIKFPADYFNETKEKFREFKVKKGKKVGTPDEFIERSGFRLDTPEEVSKISVAKRVQELKRQGKSPSQSAIDYAMSL